MRHAATQLFRDGLAKAVAYFRCDRAAEDAGGVSESVWYDAITGHAVPHDLASDACSSGRIVEIGDRSS